MSQGGGLGVREVTGRDALIELLLDEGVDLMFGNPGTTELPLMEAVARYPRFRYVLGLQEASAMAMAEGFARASGRLVACNLHCMPGLGNAMGALYSAKFSGAPVIVTAGQYPQGHGLTEPMLYEPLVPIAAPLVKWSAEVTRLEDLPRILRRAAKLALTPPMGPVFISLPGDVLDAKATIDLGRPTRVETASPPSARVLDAMVAALLGAERPAIIAGRELAERDAFEQAQALAERLGAAVYRESVPYNARFASTHRAFMGELGRDQRRVRDTLAAHDLVLCLGADMLRMSLESEIDPLPPGLRVLHLSERDWELAKNYPVELAVRADGRESLEALLPLLDDAAPSAFRAAAAARLDEIASRNWSARLAAAPAAGRGSGAMAPAAAMAALTASLPPDAIVVEEALTATPALMASLRTEDRHGYYGLASGGLGFAVPGAVGISFAHPDRPVVAVVGDGSSLYSVQGMWTAAHFRRPVTFVIVNNRSYRIIKERLVALRGTDRFTAMDLRDPAIDFMALARGFGLSAARVTDAAEVGAAIRDAIASGAPSLIELVVADGFDAGAAAQ
ncbi:MAG: thiamine pyrophosphate-binding protein [Burkholderiaceae bacterium]